MTIKSLSIDVLYEEFSCLILSIYPINKCNKHSNKPNPVECNLFISLKMDLFIVFKPNLFVSNYKKRIKQNIQRIRKLPKLKGIKKIYYPGERKAERYKNNLKKEIKIPKSILDELIELNKS